MIELIPANYDTKKVYSNDPAAIAQDFEQQGFKRLHVVDLDGAKSKHVVNDATLKRITSQTRLKVDFGGGLKTQEDLEKAFSAGAAMVTIGSIAVTAPQLYLEWLQTYGADRLVLGADVRNGKVSINGWQEESCIELPEFLTQYMQAGTRNVLCTEIISMPHNFIRKRVEAWASES